MRRFSVHGVEDAPSRGRQLQAASFEAAALEFVDAHPVADEDGEVALMVEDCETGERQCFRVDVASGETEPCD
ncbi:hypothetical protein DJ017_15900 [Phenylobacterium soli]|uniref:Uncharacterized protein n=1 Tax=Phenylobacterium soli TaxID=2170551 RepID=A0A328AN22_9CAUL|nr:hypothetical protein DJ017_15900 [Phenylobacterium soli]